MYIYTIITKKSIREINEKRRFLKFYSFREFKNGDVIEIIIGGRKNPAIILKKELIKDFKTKIRTKEINAPKLTFSKTGIYKDGIIVSNIKIDKIKLFISDGNLFKAEIKEKFLKNFFPIKKDKRKKENKIIEKKGVSDMKNILKKYESNRYIKKKQYTSELQEIVDKIRKYYQEQNVFGTGSFPYYASFVKKLGIKNA